MGENEDKKVCPAENKKDCLLTSVEIARFHSASKNAVWNTS